MKVNFMCMIMVSLGIFETSNNDLLSHVAADARYKNPVFSVLLPYLQPAHRETTVYTGHLT